MGRTDSARTDTRALKTTSITDPGVNEAVSTTILDTYSGVIITTTTTGNAQTLQTPTNTTEIKRFSVINNDTSTNSITVNGVVVGVGEVVYFVRDGSAWVEGGGGGGGGSVEGTDVLSTGETGGVKFLREDGDGTCSWQTPAGSGDMLLGTIQTVTAEKIFNKDKISMLGTSTGKNIVSVANASAIDYTNIIPAKNGTFAMTDDLSGYELLANKSTDVVTDGASDIKYPSVKAIKDYADSLVVGLLDYRGAYDASVNTFPATGGSGTAGAILKGDMWIVSVAGTLGGEAVQIGDSIIASVDTPGQTASNWNILNSNIAYVPEDVANKSTTLDTDKASDTKYPSVKSVYDWAVGLFLKLSGGSLTGALNQKQGTAIASATTTDIGAATGNSVNITGTTTITGLGTIQAGTQRTLTFDGILTLTYNATSLILPTSANITTAVGDTADFISLGSGNWICTNYQRKSGEALVGGGGSITYSASGTVFDGNQGLFHAGQSGTIAEVNAIVGTAPTGSALTVDVYVDSVKIGTVTISASGTTGSQTSFTDTTLTKYDEVYYDVTGGTTIAGADLTINMILS